MDAILGFRVLLLLMAAGFQFSVIISDETVHYYPEERKALLQFINGVSSSSDLHLSWRDNPCLGNKSKWVGIACSKGHVIHLVLEGFKLEGSLPQTLFQKLTLLQKLSFRNNSISGSLPDLTRLAQLEQVMFSHNQFSGPIPLEYDQLSLLKTLELQENSLNGSIPPFNQSTLSIFNVSANNLEGPIPSVMSRFSKSSYDHNPKLCGDLLEKQCPVIPLSPSPPFGSSRNASRSPPPSLPSQSPPRRSKDALKVWTIALIVSAAVFVSFSAIVFFLFCYRRLHIKRGQSGGISTYAEWDDGKILRLSESMGDPERIVELELFDKNIPPFDLDDLLRASAEVLGKGKLGTTYKALLDSGSVVAVKRVKEVKGLSKKEFMHQMGLLGKMKHENLVEIISFFYSKEENLVIYEFVPDGNLFELLHENKFVEREALNWKTRLAIIKDIAKGLTFLHQALPSHKIPHGNLKSSNVLIHNCNQYFRSKLTDFGYIPLFSSRGCSRKLAVGKSPEFYQGKKLTHKSDIYCFGIIILEVITGRIPGQILGGNNTMNDLSDWVVTVVNTNWSTDILDVEILATKEGQEEMLKLTEIALHCTDTDAEKRPTMDEVLRKIEEIEHGGGNGK